MSTDRETTRIVRSWLEEGATALPDRVLDAVLDQVPATPQRHAWRPAWMFRVMKALNPTSSRLDVFERTEQRHALRVLRRYPSMSGLVKFAAAAVVVAVVGGFAFVALQPKAPPTVAGPAASATASPTAPLETGNATAIAAGVRHACAITRGDGVKCWGDNFYGELGNGLTTNSGAPVDVSGLASGVRAIVAGWAHTCALTASGGVKCWGDNRAGQLGNGTSTDSAKPVDVSGLTSGVTAITAGAYMNCALTDAGAVKCWGGGGEGQLGNGSSKSSSTPVDVSGLRSGITAISVGGLHACALTSAGAVKCWGWNKYGQLGNGSTTGSTVPVDVSGLASGATAIAAGDTHTCALTSAGGVKCWGFNGGGQLGNGTSTDSAAPVEVAGLPSRVTAIAASMVDTGFTTSGRANRIHTCALTNGGGVTCWGGNSAGQLGNGSTTKSSTPVDVSGLGSGVTAIAVRGEYSCALTTGGAVVCWGSNANGQLGDGTTTSSLVPVIVKGL